MMSQLSQWLRKELDRRELTLARAAVFAGVGQATLSDVLTKGHIPKVETLFRLADYFGISREEILRLAADLPPAPSGTVPAGSDEPLLRDLIEEFRQVPDEWKAAAVEQVAFVRRMAQRPPVREIRPEPKTP